VIVHNVEWVVKISKLCNLRCTYCYEFPFLADRTRMRLEDLRIMFRHIAEFYAARPKRMDFVWHGGEPLLIEPTYYSNIFRDPRTRAWRGRNPLFKFSSDKSCIAV